MNAKHSAILLTGLLFLMIGLAWAQRESEAPPTCPPLEDKALQDMLQPSAWARANWNMNTSRWEIDCTQLDAIANMAPPPWSNSVVNAANAAAPARTRPGQRRSNSNYVNTDPYNYLRNVDPNANTVMNANMPRNTNRVRPAMPVKREPNTRNTVN